MTKRHMGVPNKAYLKTEYLKEYVKDNIKEKDKFKAPRDIYNIENRRGQDISERKVTKFYEHYVMTVDDYGRNETFQYFDMFMYLHGVYKWE